MSVNTDRPFIFH